jgi:3(or 17)beta-hydroxysteroid dehydrogenase
MGRVDGKVAIVTGGAGGLGLAMCRMLVAEGATVFATDIAPGDAVGATGAHFIAHDVTREQDWERVMATVAGRAGGVDVVVNNAGIAVFADLENTTLEQWERVQRVNSTGTFLGCRAAVRAMKARGGSIVNISSVGGMLGLDAYAAYCASKGAVRNFTKVVAAHCRTRNYPVRCNSVHPGPIATAMAAGARAAAGGDAGAAFTHMGTPEDVAYMVLFLASDESRHVNGAEMLVDDAMAAS